MNFKVKTTMAYQQEIYGKGLPPVVNPPKPSKIDIFMFVLIYILVQDVEEISVDTSLVPEMDEMLEEQHELLSEMKENSKWWYILPSTIEKEKWEAVKTAKSVTSHFR